MPMDKKLREKLSAARENHEYHAPYGGEYGYYDAVRKGDVILLRKKHLAVPIHEAKGLGTLSGNGVRNILYHVIISIALISRYCIEDGMEPEVAYSLSDLYIQRADGCKTKEEIADLHREMTLDFASRMRVIQKKQIYSRHVIVCMEYIYENLNEKITLRELAGLTRLHENYLSQLFKKETGKTVMQYVQEKKLEQAEYRLKHTEDSILEIANDLNFSSQSYFIQVFKRKNGRTPREYREHYFRKNLENDIGIFERWDEKPEGNHDKGMEIQKACRQS